MMRDLLLAFYFTLLLSFGLSKSTITPPVSKEEIRSFVPITDYYKQKHQFRPSVNQLINFLPIVNGQIPETSFKTSEASDSSGISSGMFIHHRPNIRSKRFWRGWRNRNPSQTTPPTTTTTTPAPEKKGWTSWFSKAASKVKDAVKKGATEVKESFKNWGRKIKKHFVRSDDNFHVFVNKVKDRVDQGDKDALDLLNKLGINVNYDKHGQATGSVVSKDAGNITDILINEGYYNPANITNVIVPVNRVIVFPLHPPSSVPIRLSSVTPVVMGIDSSVPKTTRAEIGAYLTSFQPTTRKPFAELKITSPTLMITKSKEISNAIGLLTTSAPSLVSAFFSKSSSTRRSPVTKDFPTIPTYDSFLPDIVTTKIASTTRNYISEKASTSITEPKSSPNLYLSKFTTKTTEFVSTLTANPFSTTHCSKSTAQTSFTSPNTVITTKITATEQSKSGSTSNTLSTFQTNTPASITTTPTTLTTSVTTTTPLASTTPTSTTTTTTTTTPTTTLTTPITVNTPATFPETTTTTTTTPPTTTTTSMPPPPTTIITTTKPTITTTTPPTTTTTTPPTTTTTTPPTTPPTTSTTTSPTTSTTTSPTTTTTTPPTTTTTTSPTTSTTPPTTTTTTTPTTTTTTTPTTTTTTTTTTPTTTKSRTTLKTTTTTKATKKISTTEAPFPPPFPDIFSDSAVRDRLHELFINGDFSNDDMKSSFNFDPANYEDYEY